MRIVLVCLHRTIISKHSSIVSCCIAAKGERTRCPWHAERGKRYSNRELRFRSVEREGDYARSTNILCFELQRRQRFYACPGSRCAARLASGLFAEPL